MPRDVSSHPFKYFQTFLAMEGWVIFVAGLNEEVTEEEVEDKFADFGKIREVRMNLDHQTGYVKVLSSLFATF